MSTTPKSRTSPPLPFDPHELAVTLGLTGDSLEGMMNTRRVVIHASVMAEVGSEAILLRAMEDGVEEAEKIAYPRSGYEMGESSCELGHL